MGSYGAYYWDYLKGRMMGSTDMKKAVCWVEKKVVVTAVRKAAEMECMSVALKAVLMADGSATK
jgi:hypothetical protein